MRVDWLWFIIGILTGKFLLDMVLMFVMGLFARIRGGSSASMAGA